MTERVILQRISDFVEDILSVAERLEEDEEWETLILDFKDAFKHLVVSENERRHLGGRAIGGTFVYRALLFRIKESPLLWGKFAALLMRLTSAMNKEDNCRMQCYVDDPAITVGGNLRTRNKVMLKKVLLSMVFGLKLA